MLVYPLVQDASYFQAISDIASKCSEFGVEMPSAALSWLLQQPAVKSVIVGASCKEQVVKNASTVPIQKVGNACLHLVLNYMNTY